MSISSVIQELKESDYRYILSRQQTPHDEKFIIVDSSDSTLDDPVEYVFEIKNCDWRLEISPSNGWGGNTRDYYIVLTIGMIMVLFLSVFSHVIIIFKEQRENLKKMSLHDYLTGVNNRNGFDYKVSSYLEKHPKSKCVGVALDIDDFKIFNDIYGHAIGDEVLKKLVADMRDSFKNKAILGRVGGDEFCMFFYDCDYSVIEQKLNEFVKSEHYIMANDEKITFTISLGFAQYPFDSKVYLELMRCADKALYEVKFYEKNGCQKYKTGMGTKKRKQLGFALKEVSENLPGAFLIFRADKDNDEILFANHELLKWTCCKDINEFLEYTNNRFSNLICADEKNRVLDSIWNKIDDNNVNDYISFNMLSRDGSLRKVHEHGRIVNNLHYGKIVYVTFADVNLIEKSMSV